VSGRRDFADNVGQYGASKYVLDSQTYGFVFGLLAGNCDNLIVESQDTPRIILHHRAEFGQAHALGFLKKKIAADEALQTLDLGADSRLR